MTASWGHRSVAPGSYHVSESGLPAGWTENNTITCQNKTQDPFTYDSVAGFPVATGDSVVCTITNTRDTGSVTVIKHWVGGANGETPTVNLNVVGLSPSTTPVTGLGNGSTGNKTVVTGTYSATESELAAGWTQTGASCVKNATGSSFDPTNFSVGVSDSVVCTFTNTRSTGTVKVNKVWVGGADGETPTVNLNVVGLSPSTTPVTGLGNGSTGNKTVVTGTYSATELELAAGWTQTDASCLRDGDGIRSTRPTSRSRRVTVWCARSPTLASTGTVKVNKVWVGGADGETPTVNLYVVGLSPSTTPVTGLGNGSTGQQDRRDRHLFGHGVGVGCGLDSDRCVVSA